MHLEQWGRLLIAEWRGLWSHQGSFSRLLALYSCDFELLCPRAEYVPFINGSTPLRTAGESPPLVAYSPLVHTRAEYNTNHVSYSALVHTRHESHGRTQSKKCPHRVTVLHMLDKAPLGYGTYIQMKMQTRHYLKVRGPIERVSQLEGVA